MKSNPLSSARYSSLIERGKMSGEPDLSPHQRVPPASPSVSLRRNSLHEPDHSHSSLRRSSTTDSAGYSPYYSSPSHLSNTLRRSATNQSAGSHHNTDQTSDTPVSFSRYSSLLEDQPERG